MESAMIYESKAIKRQRARWFEHDRFGLFIHFGLYSIPSRGEWLMSNERIPYETYREAYFDQFNPVNYDPSAWAKLAKRAGMRYVVMTAKHHDGFCLFDSRYTDYKATNTPFGRDLVREYLEAFRAEGLKVGLYFSLIDWSHDDYPKFHDRHHPMRGSEAYRDERIRFDRYLDFMHAQVEELVTGYGKLDLLWFDFAYDDMRGEKWRATDLIRMVRKHQPDVIIDNRIEGSGEHHGSLIHDRPLIYSGDFASPEQVIPPQGVTDNAGNPVPWELCLTMNNHWGYFDGDNAFKPAPLLIHKLVECVSKGGNMILNVGPDASGRFPAESVAILNAIGDWMAANGESIYGAGIADYAKPEWGRYTQNGKTVYAHVFETPIGPLHLTGIRNEDIDDITYLSDGRPVNREEAWNTVLFRDAAFVSFGDNPVYTYPLPDSTDTVLKITLH